MRWCHVSIFDVSILPLFHYSIIKSDEKWEKMVTRGEHWGRAPLFLLYDLRYGQGGLNKWPIKVTIEADIWPRITAHQILCGEQNWTIECEEHKLKRNMLQLLKVFVWAILQVKPPQYLRISMQSKNTFECHWWRLRQIAWLEVIHEPRQKVHVCKIGSTRKVNSPKVYLCILFFVGGKNHSDVSLVIGDRAFDNWTKNRIFCQKRIIGLKWK